MQAFQRARLTYAQSASKTAQERLPPAGLARPWPPDPQGQPEHGQHSPGGSGSASPAAARTAGGGDQPGLSFAQQVQSLLQGLTQQQLQQQQNHAQPVLPIQTQPVAGEQDQGPQSGAEDATQWGPAPKRRQAGAGRRGPMHTSPAVPRPAPTGEGEEEEEVGARSERQRRSGRRWRAQPPREQAVQGLREAGRPRTQGREVRRESASATPRQAAAPSFVGAGAAAGVGNGQSTPAPPPRSSNPLAALLAGSASSTAKKGSRTATTGNAKAKHPLYRTGLTGSLMLSQSKPAAGEAGSAARGTSRLRQPALASPHHSQQAWRQQQQPQQMHKLYGTGHVASRPAAAAAAGATQLGLRTSSSQQQELQQPAGATAGSLRLLLGTDGGAGPGSAEQQELRSRRREREWQSRQGQPVLQAQPELIDEAADGWEEDDEQQQQGAEVQKQQQQAAEVQEQQERQAQAGPGSGHAAAVGSGHGQLGQPALAGAAGEQAVTPGPNRIPGIAMQPPGSSAVHRRPPPALPAGQLPGSAGATTAWRVPGVQGATLLVAAAEAPGGLAGGWSSAAGGGLSLQRQFIAQLAPVNHPAVPATHQQRQRLAGVAGLYGRLQVRGHLQVDLSSSFAWGPCSGVLLFGRGAGDHDFAAAAPPCAPPAHSRPGAVRCP